MGHILRNHKIIVNIFKNSVFVIFNTYYNVIFSCDKNITQFNYYFLLFNQVEMIISNPRTNDFAGSGPTYNH